MILSIWSVCLGPVEGSVLHRPGEEMTKKRQASCLEGMASFC